MNRWWMVSWILALAAPRLFAADANTPEARIAALGLQLPGIAAPVANYVGAVRSGSMIFLAGHIPRDADGNVITGQVGRDLDEAAANNAARQATLALLATLKSEIGGLARVKRVVRVGGFVNAAPDFTRHSQVINGCSDLLVEIFGERGRHARSAVGVSSLPLDAAVEIEMIVEVE